MASLKQQSIRALIWSGGESFGLVVLSFVTFLVMARVLEPVDFGLVALAGAFIFFFNLIANQGFTDALVQREELATDHLHSAFWCTLGIALALAGLCIAGADLIAGLLGEPRMAPVLRWLAPILPLNALAAVQMALLRRAICFRLLAVRTLGGRVTGAAVGITMALTGFGVWSLVAQQLVGSALIALSLWGVSVWRPRLRLSLPHLRQLWSFGVHVSATQVIVAMSEQALNLLIGALAGPVMLGYFTIAFRMVEILKSLISSAVYHVSFNAFSRLQNDLPAMRAAFLQSTRVSCLFGFPIAAGMAVLAEPLVVTVFGAKWAASAPLVQVLALGLMVAFYTMFYTALFRALGRPSISLYTATSSLVLGAGGIALLAPLGIFWITVAWVGRFMVLVPILVLLSRNLLGIGGFRLVAPAMPPLALAAVMAAVVQAVVLLLPAGLPTAAQLAVAVPVGAAVYPLLAWLLFPQMVHDTLQHIRILVAPARRRPATPAPAPTAADRPPPVLRPVIRSAPGDTRTPVRRSA